MERSSETKFYKPPKTKDFGKNELERQRLFKILHTDELKEQYLSYKRQFEEKWHRIYDSYFRDDGNRKYSKWTKEDVMTQYPDWWFPKQTKVRNIKLHFISLYIRDTSPQAYRDG